MTELTREQIQQMTPEQQEVFAQLETQRVKKEMELIERAKGSGSTVLNVVAILSMVAISIVSYSFEPDLIVPMLFLVILGSTMCQLVAASHKKRLDAIYELLQEKSK